MSQSLHFIFTFLKSKTSDLKFRAASCKKLIRKNNLTRKNKSTRKHILYLKMCFLVDLFFLIELFFLIDFYMKRSLIQLCEVQIPILIKITILKLKLHLT